MKKKLLYEHLEQIGKQNNNNKNKQIKKVGYIIYTMNRYLRNGEFRDPDLTHDITPSRTNICNIPS